MKKYGLITCIALLSASLAFANDDAAKQQEAAAGPAIEEPSGAQAAENEQSTTSTEDTDTQASEASRIVVDPSGAKSEVGTIILQGTVQTVQERDQIEKHLKQMPGIKKVDNRITIVGDLQEPAGAEKTEDEALDDPEDDDSDDDDAQESDDDADSSTPGANQSPTP